VFPRASGQPLRALSLPRYSPVTPRSRAYTSARASRRGCRAPRPERAEGPRRSGL